MAASTAIPTPSSVWTRLPPLAPSEDFPGSNVRNFTGAPAHLLSLGGRGGHRADDPKWHNSCRPAPGFPSSRHVIGCRRGARRRADVSMRVQGLQRRHCSGCLPCRWRPGPRRDQYPVVARDDGRAWPPARSSRRRLQQRAIGLPDHSDLQRQLHRNRHGRDFRRPHAIPSGNRPGQRDRDRDHDGRARRRLSGLRADARRRRGFQPVGLSARSDRLLRRRCRQHAVVSVQFIDADPLLQQGSIPQSRPRCEHAAENLARGRGHGPQAATRRRCPAASPPIGRPG